MSGLNSRVPGLRWSGVIVGLSVCGWVIGCSGTDSEGPGAATTAGGTQDAVSDVGAAGDVQKNDAKLTPVDLEGYREAIDRHRGEAVLVDFWATWCEPCKRMFPHTLELARKYRDKGLTVISFSFDDPEQRAEALDFLRSQNGEVENLVAGFPEGSEPFELLDITGGAIPHFKLYDREGKLHQKFFFDDAGSRFTLQSIDAAVLELLSAKD